MRVQLLGLFGINRAIHVDARKARRRLTLVALAFAAVVALIAAYMTTMGEALAAMGAAALLPPLAVTMCALAGLCTTFVKANGVLFSRGDYDAVVSLPVPLWAVVCSRIASLYAMSLLVGACMAVPLLGVYASHVAVGVANVACMVLAVVLAPIVPGAVAIALAALVAVLSSRFRHANAVMGVVSILLVVVVVGVSFAVSAQNGTATTLSGWDASSGLSGSGEPALDLAADVADRAHVSGEDRMSGDLGGDLFGWYPLATWAAAGMMRGDAAMFGLFVGVSVAVAVVLIAGLTHVFSPVNELLRSRGGKGGFAFGDVRGDAQGVRARGVRGIAVRSPLRALAAKEARLMLATPIYLMNSCCGFVLVVIAAAGAAVARVSGALPLDAIPAAYTSVIAAVLPWVVGLFLGVAAPTTASVSLEGSARWIMLSAPLPACTVLGSKALTGLAISLPVAVASGALLSFAFAFDGMQTAFTLIVLMGFSACAAMLGLKLDAWRPRYTWTTPYEPVKRGMPVYVTMAVAFVPAVIGVAATIAVGMAGAWAVACALVVVAAVLWCACVRGGVRA